MIVIKEIRSINSGARKAHVDVELHGIRINNWSVVQDGKARPWVSVPQASWIGPDGKLRYRNLVAMTDSDLAAVRKTILDAWSAKEAANA